MSSSFLDVRMKYNPLFYGSSCTGVARQSSMDRLREVCRAAIENLVRLRIASFNQKADIVSTTELGRVASQYYVDPESVARFASAFSECHSNDGVLSYKKLLALLATSKEFESLRVRREEQGEIDSLSGCVDRVKETFEGGSDGGGGRGRKSGKGKGKQLLKQLSGRPGKGKHKGNRELCPYDLDGGIEEYSHEHKVFVLVQVHISGGDPTTGSLISDTNYIMQNAPRILRAMFEIALSIQLPHTAVRLLELATAVEHKTWHFMSPLWHVVGTNRLTGDVVRRLEQHSAVSHMRLDNVENILALDNQEIRTITGLKDVGPLVKRAAMRIPRLELIAEARPVSCRILKLDVVLRCTFEWEKRLHGSSVGFWVMVYDPINSVLHHSERVMFDKAMANSNVTLPLAVRLDPDVYDGEYPRTLYVWSIPDNWAGKGTLQSIEVNLTGLIVPEESGEYTNVPLFSPLSKRAMHWPEAESLFGFDYFNPLQTSYFHRCYHSEGNVIIGAPTGSGKTIAAELCLLQMLRDHPQRKAVYIAPLKTLVRERVNDWQKFRAVGASLVEITGDVLPDSDALRTASILVTTPEKFDAVSRHWQTKRFVQLVGLVIIDECHLLGTDRGPVLESIVSRLRFISDRYAEAHKIRFLGLTTSVANPQDMADWLGVADTHTFNFPPSARPVSLETHIQHSPSSPVIVFVSSRRQTRLTAQALIAFSSIDDSAQGLGFDVIAKLPRDDLQMESDSMLDPDAKRCLQYGIGLHHAGMTTGDRSLVEKLFLSQRIKLVIATSTLAWGVNMPSYCVIVKGCQYFDGATKRYTNYSVTDIMQMIGRAGRPQFCQERRERLIQRLAMQRGVSDVNKWLQSIDVEELLAAHPEPESVAVVLCHNPSKPFFRRFLYDPFPVESAMSGKLEDTLVAEIASGLIASVDDLRDWLHYTFYYRRVPTNPGYYSLIPEDIGYDLSEGYGIDGKRDIMREAGDAHAIMRANEAIDILTEARCIDVINNTEFRATSLGHLASLFYLNHTSAVMLHECLFKSHPNRYPPMSADSDSDYVPTNWVTALMEAMAACAEFEQVPVRHNEDNDMEHMVAQELRQTRRAPDGTDVFEGGLRMVPPGCLPPGSPSYKTHILLQTQLSRALPGGAPTMPCADFWLDLASVMDQAVRLSAAAIECAAGCRLSDDRIIGVRSMIDACRLSAGLVQGLWPDSDSRLCLQSIRERLTPKSHLAVLDRLSQAGLPSLAHMAHLGVGNTQQKKALRQVLQRVMGGDISDIIRDIARVPLVSVRVEKGENPHERERETDQAKKETQGATTVGPTVYDITEGERGGEREREGQAFLCVMPTTELRVTLRHIGTIPGMFRSEIFPKQKPHSVYVAVCVPPPHVTDDVIAQWEREGYDYSEATKDWPVVVHKRVAFDRSTRFAFQIQSRRRFLCMYVLSDTYLGTDQCYVLDTRGGQVIVDTNTK
ncbi:hypothetical protein KIPB_000961 [Kipferlia bialata]|uniref:Activating signal cointegrator 1 complex subunit 3 n=1 Tax=Kipferlia bialata TaxID=797122 RepID=A0A9K3GEX4_9EUKA|nr:hypothetical protein KIPB_000961 [Kipferlia bialata]|eukprot:g961.t1